MTLPIEEFTPEAPSGELVHWMQPGHMRLEPPGVAVTAVAAFALGIAAAFGALAAFRWLAPRREGLPPWKWRRGSVH
jgi:hypothetical protein